MAAWRTLLLNVTDGGGDGGNRRLRCSMQGLRNIRAPSAKKIGVIFAHLAPLVGPESLGFCDQSLSSSVIRPYLALSGYSFFNIMHCVAKTGKDVGSKYLDNLTVNDIFCFYRIFFLQLVLLQVKQKPYSSEKKTKKKEKKRTPPKHHSQKYELLPLQQRSNFLFAFLSKLMLFKGLT